MSDYVLDRPGTSDDARALRAELVGRAREIVPVLARNAARTEQDRRIVEENISLIDEAGLFAIMKPARLGGGQTDFRTKLEVSRELARGCGSTSWATTLINLCSWFAGLFPDQAQRDVWEAEPGNRIVGVLAPSAEAVEVDGGYRVTGKWGWASGCLHAQWAEVGIPVPDAHGEVVDQGLALIPMSDLTIEDTWYVAGMRGTGSNTLVAKDVFVPQHRIISLPAAIAGRYGTEHTDEVLYRAAADIDQAAVDGVYPDYAARARVRKDTGWAIEQAREAIRVLVSAHGASGFAETSPLQRIWRDSEVASRHAVVSPAISSEVYGRALLGITDGVTALV